MIKGEDISIAQERRKNQKRVRRHFFNLLLKSEEPLGIKKMDIEDFQSSTKTYLDEDIVIGITEVLEGWGRYEEKPLTKEAAELIVMLLKHKC